MNDKDRGLEAAFEPEFWHDVEKTLAETAPPSGFDARALVSRSLRAYWDERESIVQEQIQRETATIFRTLAERFRDPWREFWLESFLAAAPAALVLGTFAVKKTLPDWWPPTAVISSLLLLAPLVRIARKERLAPPWLWLRNSVGALAGSLLIAAAMGLWLHAQRAESVRIVARLEAEKEKSAKTAALFAVDKLEEISLTSLDNRLTAGTFLSPRMDLGLLSVTTSHVTEDRAVYKASLPNLPGEMVASLRPDSGEVRWAWRGTEEIRSRFAVGTFVHAAQETVRIAEPGQAFLDLRLSPARVGPLPPAGEQVLVAYDPKDLTLQRILVRTHTAGLISDREPGLAGPPATISPQSDPSPPLS